MDKYLIGLDIGTGSVKAVAMNQSGTVLSSTNVHYEMLTSPQGHCEQDPEVIFKAFMKSIRQITAMQKQPPFAIGLSSAMHSLVLIDKFHKPVSPLLTWADNRAGNIAKSIRLSEIGEKLYQQSGTPLHAMSPLFKIMWFREKQQETFRAAEKFVSIKEYIWHQLFETFEVDYSIASACGLMDIEELSWNKTALDLAGIKEHNLSVLVNTDFKRTNCRDQYCEEMGIDRACVFVIGGSDGCMANLGSFATKPGVGALTIGTSGAIRVASERPIHNFNAMTFNYRLDEKTFISGGPTNNGGIIVKWYAESLLQKKLLTSLDYENLIKEIRTTSPGADGLLFLPYLLGERAPHWNSEASGSFFGIRSHHGQAQFTRAVLEGITMALYSICEKMETSGLEIKLINVSGGFVRSTEWLKIMANMFNKKLCLLNVADASALGAAYIALKSTGHINSYAELHPKQVTEINPDEGIHLLYRKQYQRFNKLYLSLEHLMN